MIGSLPFFIRWFVHFDNVAGDKQRGVRNLELVASEGPISGRWPKSFSASSIYARKSPRKRADCWPNWRTIIPRNPLYRKELDKLQLKLALNR